MKLCEDQSAAIHHNPERLKAAYDKVYPEAIAERGTGMLKPDEIQPYLDELARPCEVHSHPSEVRFFIVDSFLYEVETTFQGTSISKCLSAHIRNSHRSNFIGPVVCF